MLRIATEEGNQVHLKPKDLSVENLPSFAGVVMPSLSDIVERNALDVLTAEKIIVGDGLNKIKDSNIDATSDNIDLPSSKAYKINGTTLLNHNGTYYNLDNIDNIRSAIDENLNIDAQGTGRIIMSTLANGGCKFVGADADNWGVLVTNSTDSTGVVIGTYNNGLEDQPTIGANDTALTVWDNLWINPGGKTIIGNATRADVTGASDPRLYVLGNSYLNGTMNVINTSRFWNYIDLNYSNSGGSHRLTSQPSNPAQLYNHYFQEEHGTVAHKTDVIIGNYSAGSSGQSCSPSFEALFNSGKTLSKVDA